MMSKVGKAKGKIPKKPAGVFKAGKDKLKKKVRTPKERKPKKRVRFQDTSPPDEIDQDDILDDNEDHIEDDNEDELEPKQDVKGPNKDRVEARKKRKFDFERNERTIFVGNLPNTMDQKAVVKLFKECGPVETARIRSIVPEKEKLSPKVALITGRMHPKVDSFNAYVVFENADCIEKALELNGRVIDGHHIRVDRAKRPNSKKETLTSRKKSVFVGNLRFDLRDDDLINHFEKVGSVNYVRIIRDKATGLGKGFAFVVFHDRATVKEALKLEGTDYKGRTLRVKKVEKESDEGDKKGASMKTNKQPAKVIDKKVEKDRRSDKEPSGNNKFAIKISNKKKSKKVNPNKNFKKGANNLSKKKIGKKNPKKRLANKK